MANRKWYELGLLTLSSLLTTVLFWDGSLDIEIASLFFQAGHADNPWPFKHYWLWEALYDFAFPSVVVIGVVALLVFLSGFVINACVRFRYPAVYLIAVILSGPVLMVNLVLKDHWGRPRPKEIAEFNGSYHYQPPTVIGDSDRKSFVCGHCSSGHMFFAFYFILNKGKNLAFLCTLFYSFLIGFSRMAAGGHFVSDVIWSGFVVFGVCWFLYYIVFRELHYDEKSDARTEAINKNGLDKRPEWINF